MKTKAYLNLAIVLAFGLAGSNGCIAQTTAAGHITAEVIESASASSQDALTASPGSSTAGIAGANTQLAAISPSFNTGTMTVNSGINATVEVVLKSAILSDFQWNIITLDPGVNNNAKTSVSQSAGFGDINLNGKANLAAGEPSGPFTGSYTVVFAYN